MLNLKRQLVFGLLHRRRQCLRTILSTDFVSSSVIKRADFGRTCMADFLPIRMRLDTLGWRRFDPCWDWFSPAGVIAAARIYLNMPVETVSARGIEASMPPQ